MHNIPSNTTQIHHPSNTKTKSSMAIQKCYKDSQPNTIENESVAMNSKI